MSASGWTAGLRALFERWADAWLAARNRMLSNPGFQRWAARSLLTRFIARRRAAALFDLTAGFVYSQILHAVARLGLLEHLRDGPRALEELADRLELSCASMLVLLDAAASLRLVQARGGRYALGIHGCSYVGNPALANLVEHHAIFYRDLADPVALLRGELDAPELNRFWSYTRRGAPQATAREVSAYSELMATSVALLAEDVIESYPFREHRRLLDVGGGEGAFLEAVARATPELELSLFDLPPVAARASVRLDHAGLTHRVRVCQGDWFTDPLPTGADLVTLVRVLHDHDDHEVMRLLTAIRRVMAPGSVLLVAEPMRGTAGLERVGDAYFGFYMLAMGQGRPRTPEQLCALLRRAGFEPSPRPTRRPMISQMISARAT
ncbi:MAG: methyltransferase domain-containing protein [Deltaproteobacteria bacterium]|nr:methyltransferase domain-containing protein [Nannocystaceae bacterium]